MKIGNFLKETQSELRQVSWPTRRQAVNYTLLVIGVSAAVAILLGVSDVVFAFLLRLVI